jgi:hypothetical protein
MYHNSKAAGALAPCFCMEGYVRNRETNQCVLVDECPVVDPPECGENEARKGCETDCLGRKQCFGILPGGLIPCSCAEGYVKDLESGKCVLPEDCPVPACEGLNEVRNGCETYCDGSAICIKLKPGSVPPCSCDVGYARDGNGNCVPADECTTESTPCTGSNEERTSCEYNCDGVELCAAIRPGGILPCLCAEGFVRNNDGQCIFKEGCSTPPECGENEARTGCETDCEYNTFCVDLAPGAYSPCFCAEGYVRDRQSGNCVYVEECPRVEPPPCDGLHEIRTGCETNCDNMTLCASILPGGYPPCFCADGYVRNDERQCVVPSECPAPACKDPNESYYCKCADSVCNEPDIQCIQCLNGCYCNEGFVRDVQGGTCIPLEKCAMYK